MANETIVTWFLKRCLDAFSFSLWLRAANDTCTSAAALRSPVGLMFTLSHQKCDHTKHDNNDMERFDDDSNEHNGNTATAAATTTTTTTTTTDPTTHDTNTTTDTSTNTDTDADASTNTNTNDSEMFTLRRRPPRPGIMVIVIVSIIISITIIIIIIVIIVRQLHTYACAWPPGEACHERLVLRRCSTGAEVAFDGRTGNI